MKLGPLEIVLILLIILMVFGVGKLPQMGAAIGKSIRAFKDGQQGEEEEEAAAPRRRSTRRKSTARAKAARSKAADEET